jgi:hypothetical protein
MASSVNQLNRNGSKRRIIKDILEYRHTNEFHQKLKNFYENKLDENKIQRIQSMFNGYNNLNNNAKEEKIIELLLKIYNNSVNLGKKSSGNNGNSNNNGNPINYDRVGIENENGMVRYHYLSRPPPSPQHTKGWWHKYYTLIMHTNRDTLTTPSFKNILQNIPEDESGPKISDNNYRRTNNYKRIGTSGMAGFN